jgi:CDP-glycerol glycerophosphotransferase
LYAPTYRQTDVSSQAYYYQFNDHEITYLKKILRDNNAILGYRPHYFNNSTQYFNFDKYIDNELIFDFSQGVVPEIAAAIRECCILVTDYSSVYLDALYLRKPAICFAYDLEQYKQDQDGLLYDLSLVFWGQVHHCFTEVVKSIGDKLSMLPNEKIDTSIAADKIFFKYHDSYNSRRVVDNVKKSLKKN